MNIYFTKPSIKYYVLFGLLVSMLYFGFGVSYTEADSEVGNTNSGSSSGLGSTGSDYGGGGGADSGQAANGGGTGSDYGGGGGGGADSGQAANPLENQTKTQKTKKDKTSEQLCSDRDQRLQYPIKITGYNRCSVPQLPFGYLNGTAGAPCLVTGVPQGTITAVCSNVKPCCVVVEFSAPPKATFNIQDIFKQLMGALKGGGGGGGSQYKDYYSTSTKKDSLLTVDPNLFNDSIQKNETNLSNLDFSGGNSNTNDNSGGTDTNNYNSDTNNNSSQNTTYTPNKYTNTNKNTNTKTTSTQQRDSVETTYDYTRAVGNKSIVGRTITSDTYAKATGNDSGTTINKNNSTDNFFNQNSGFDNTPTQKTQREILEAQGLAEANRLGRNYNKRNGSLKLSYENLTPSEIRSLKNYNSSAVSGNLRPARESGFSNNQPKVEENKGVGFFQSITNFFVSLFGLGAPKN